METISLFTTIFEAVEVELTSSFAGNPVRVPVPEFIERATARIGDTEIKDVEKAVGFIVRNHPKYMCVPGRNGGIQLRTSVQARADKVAAREAAKAAVTAASIAKVAATSIDVAAPTVQADETVTDETEVEQESTEVAA